MRKRYAIDFGSDIIRVASEDGDLMLTEPAVAAIDRLTGKPICFGQDAKAMAIRTPGSVDIIYPYTDMEHIVHELLRGMLLHLADCIGLRRGLRADLVLSYPGQTGGNTEQVFLDEATEAGAGEICMVSAVYAAFRGAGAGKYQDMVLMNMGASAIDMALFVGGKILESRTLAAAGRSYDDAIGDAIYDRHALLLDDEGAEFVKKELATLKKNPAEKKEEILFAGLKAAEDEDAGIKPIPEKTAEVLGISQTTGLLKRMALKQTELTPDMEPLFVRLAAVYGDLMKEHQELTPDRVILTGGFSRMSGMAERISEMTGVHTEVALEPDSCVLRGLMTMMTEEEV